MQAIFTPLIYVFAFIAVVVFVQTVADMVFTAGDKTKTVNRRLTMLDSGMTREQVYAALVRMPDRAKQGDWRIVAQLQTLRLYCRQAGLAVSAERVMAVTAMVAGALWLVSFFMTPPAAGLPLLVNSLVSLSGAVALAVIGTWVWLARKRRARLKKIEEQLPVALDVINRALRAGHPVISAIQLAADEMSDPIGSEFGLVVDETTYGVDFDEALVNFARRTGSNDVHFFAVSVSIQAETGGNLAEVLGGLANVIRGRNTLAKRVRALSSEGRASAILISVLPMAVVAFQLLIHPRVYIDKFSDPIFWPVVGVTAIIYGIGWVMIHRIINFRY